ncbi:MAG: DEAD/DEAH box helicase family protein [Opitutaceae bacterium]|nr:DEAD/DEAH box helicase family protein [Opitutaceae bacterium]
MFNLDELKKETVNNNRYERRLAVLVDEGQEVDRIRTVVAGAIENVGKARRSFVIYGEPQSGKTEMMIALTAKLLDEGFRIVVVLLNDSVQLLGQNLERFQRSGISPAPKKFSEILSPEVKIGDHPWVIFCKKNAKDLQKLLEKLDGIDSRRVVIDDEADYATPNTKVNKQDRSRINDLTGQLLGTEGTYIGVTATPARLDLNRTHENQNEHWIDFPPHQNYTGQDKFFPVTLANMPYRLTLLGDSGDNPKYLREALFCFMVNVGHLNTRINSKEKNYSLLVHTSGNKADHSLDYKQVIKIFEALREEGDTHHRPYYQRIWEIAEKRYPGHAKEITRYVLENNGRNNVVVMNSDKEVNAADNRTATTPTSPFTVVIGGNIVSRGVTFNNLLSMFFTRDVKHKLQQDTYIQRARMFGSRKDYLKYFELIIPQSLYLDWQKCFIFHRLSLESRKQNRRTPVWLDGDRISAAASSSIDKTNVSVDRGEMSFELFDYEATKDRLAEIIAGSATGLDKLKQISTLLGADMLPGYLLNYIATFCPEGDRSLAVHLPRSIAGYTEKKGEMDKATITRSKGFIGDREMEVGRFPDAIHHVNVLFNETGRARVFYRYRGNVRFLKAGAPV